MNKLVKVIAFFVVIVFSCSKVSKDSGNSIKDSDTIVSESNADVLLPKDKEPVAIDTLEAMAIVNRLIDASIWFKEGRRWWVRNWQSMGDTIKYVVLSKALNSGKFSKTMYKTICENAERKENIEDMVLHFGSYFYNKKFMGRLLGSFCKMDTSEIIRNLTILGDSARYITKLDWVLPEPPYNVDGFEWMSEYGQNGEEWHFAVYLVKEDRDWKIDKIDHYFGISNE